MTDGSGETHWTYDQRGRMVEEVKTILNRGTYTTQWRYDNQDRVQQMFYPNGELVSFVYNYQGELAQIKRNAQAILAHRRFNEHGQVVREYFGNNTVRNYHYGDWLSTSGAISQIQTGLSNVANDSSLQNLGYTYDLIGNITELNDNGEILNFGYDNLNRLTSVSGAYQQSYTYDKKTGNLLTKSDVGNNSNYVYSSTSHPHAVTGYGAQSNLFEYDANGQMIKRYTKDITYDAQGQLVSYDGDTHVYDGDGNRVMTENENGEATVYIGNYYEKFFDIPGFIDPVEPPEQQQRSQVYKYYLPVIQNGEGADFETVPGQIYYYAGTSRIATRTEEGKIIWIYGDHLGSTSVTAGIHGNVLSRSSYYAWGTTRSSTGVQETDYGYTGQMQVDDIYYYNARWYDPTLGRFMQADTIVPPHQGTQGFDRYAYVNNNPMIYTDPSGHFPWLIVAVVVFAITNLTSDVPKLPNYPVNNSSIYECSGTVAECFGDTVSYFSENHPKDSIPLEEFTEFADKLATDLYTHDLTWPGLDSGRAIYDTPFYNGGNSEARGGDPKGFAPSNQEVCIDTIGCYGRSEINYIAQGMWGAATGEPKIISELVVRTWKFVEYKEEPSTGTLFWLNYGYDYYKDWKERMNLE